MLAVPEVATCLLEHANGLWSSEAENNATVVICAGLVGKGALSLDMMPDFSSRLREALEN